ncbi:MAG: hypothetical protein ACP5M0_06335 [Desulfomonilaceae bacterium]
MKKPVEIIVGSHYLFDHYFIEESLENDAMGTKTLALVFVGAVLATSVSYGWDNLRPPSTVAGAATPQSIAAPQSYSSNPSAAPPVPNTPQGSIPNEVSNPVDASGWPVYPYPSYHNPFYSENSARDLFSGTVDWIIGFPTTVMDRLSNFLDRKVFPQTPATHGARSPNPNGVQPLYVAPERPASLPPAKPYVKDEPKGR